MRSPRWRRAIAHFVDRDRFGNVDRFHTDQHLVDGARGKVAIDVQMAEHDDRPSLPIPVFERMMQM
jgi:hypothetical protein